MSNLNADWLSRGDLRKLPFEHLGDDVLIHPSVIILGLENVSIGSKSRIDPHTIIAAGTGRVSIGSHVHIGAGSYLAGGGSITIEDYAGLSQGVRLYSVSDDYSGRTMTNPTVPALYTLAKKAPVVLSRHVIVGSGSVILPGIHVGEGCAIGALSLVTENTEPWGVFGGIPARRLRDRRSDLLDLERAYREGRSP